MADERAIAAVDEHDILVLTSALSGERRSDYPGEAQEIIRALVRSEVFHRWLATRPAIPGDDTARAAGEGGLPHEDDFIIEAGRILRERGVVCSNSDVGRVYDWLRALLAAAPAGDDTARALDEVEALLHDYVMPSEVRNAVVAVREVRAARTTPPAARTGGDDG